MSGKRGDVNESKWYVTLSLGFFHALTSFDLVMDLTAARIRENCSRRWGLTSGRSVTWLVLGMVLLPLLIIHLLYRRLQRESLRRSRVSGAPGSFLCRLADFLCSNKTKREIADPIISDMQFEYYEALFAHRRAKAAWIRVRGCWAFFHALGLHRILKGFAGLFQQARPR
jgi:hypothetical protein